MINQQLLEYVRAQRAAGLSKEAIIQAAAAGGWTPADLEEIFLSLDSATKPPVAPTPRVITPPPQPAPTPIQQRTVEPLTPLTAVPAPTPAPRPMVSPTEIATAPAAARKHRIWPYILSAVLVLIAALIVGVYFFVWPTISQVFAPTPSVSNQPLEPVGTPIELQTATTSDNLAPTEVSTSTSPALQTTSATSTATSTATTTKH